MDSELTLQRYFDETVEYLSGLSDGSRAITNEWCVFLTPDGRKCAVGYWIPDGHEAQYCRELNANCLSHRYPDLAGIAWPDHKQGIRLADNLRKLHDEHDNWWTSGPSPRFWKQVDKIADRFDLKPYSRETRQ